MIPKIIHYCWFGHGEKPVQVKNCIASWQKNLPDYVIKEWNESNFDYSKNPYTKEAYYLKKYAFVADVCRFEALYKEGGIYLDTDVEVLHSFDDFLHLHSFIGYETNKYIGTGVVGAEAGRVWVKSFLSMYDRKHFIQRNGELDVTTNVQLITNFLLSAHLEDKPSIYDFEVFCAKEWDTGKIVVTERTVCIHHYLASWVVKGKRKSLWAKCKNWLIRNMILRS